MAFDITSASNERIKRLVRLGVRKHRDAERVFVVEGRRLISRALDAGIELVEAYSDGRVGLDLPVEPVTVAPTVLDKASYRSRSEGLIGVFRQFETSLDSLSPGENALFLAAESTEKPGNLGAMARTADAVGAEALIIVSGGADPFNPNTLRSSTGAIFSVPIAKCDLDELVEWARKHSVTLLAVDPGKGQLVWEADLTGPVCLLVGSEDAGLSPAALGASVLHLRIPMAGASDSLNVATAMAVVAFEAVRQRRR